ncbi:WXG100 family type VII secretion target [Streptomyces sp. NPDC005483]|uniref:WXG100 family type VII secretion target n=1 Tax=Streptomyces sp. NPDC005483 TaxID=3154882 RepID=UPI0033AD5652
MADSSQAPTSAAEWAVALGELHSAIGKVKGYSGEIQSCLSQIGTEFDKLGEAWRSPASATSEPVTEWFRRASQDLHELLEDMVRRMQVSYDNYLDAETKSYNNVT